MKKGTKLLIAVLSLLAFFFVSNRVSALDYDAEVQYVETTKKSVVVYLDSGLPSYYKDGWYAIVYYPVNENLEGATHSLIGKYVEEEGGLYALHYADATHVEKEVMSKGQNGIGFKNYFDAHYIPMEMILKNADKTKRIEESNYSLYNATGSTNADENQENKPAYNADDVNAVATIENGISLDEAERLWGEYQSKEYVCSKQTCDSNGDGSPDAGEYNNYYYKFVDSNGKIHLIDTGSKIGDMIREGGKPAKDKIIDIENIGTSEGTTNPCKYLFGDVTDKNSAAYLIQSIFNYIKFIGIVLAVIMTIVDLTKAVAGGNMEDEMKKIGPKSIKRIAYAILIFLLPTIINVVFKIFGLWGTCNIS